MVNNNITRQGAYPWPPFPHISSSQPFTMRDGLSYLDILQKLRKGLEKIQSEWCKYLDDMESWGHDTESAWSDFQQAYKNDFTNLREELASLIQQGNDSNRIMVYSPAYGRLVPLQTALENIFDADRVYGLFVSDFDSLNMSPKTFDALGVSPRVFDLHATDKINTVRGDITAANITWDKGEQA